MTNATASSRTNIEVGKTRCFLRHKHAHTNAPTPAASAPCETRPSKSKLLVGLKTQLATTQIDQYATIGPPAITATPKAKSQTIFQRMEGSYTRLSVNVPRHRCTNR